MDSTSQKLTFLGLEHSLQVQHELTEDLTRAKGIVGFRDGVALFPHQATVVQAIHDIESAKSITVESTRRHSKYTDQAAIIQSSGVVLSEPFGSGKTLEILALILLKQVPKAFPEHANSIIFMLPSRRYRHHNENEYFLPEVIKTFTAQGALIRPNLIVVGSSVLIQWEQAIREFTDLRYFTIGDVHSLRKFERMYNDTTADRLKPYNIVLLKNGRVTGNFSRQSADGSISAAPKNYHLLITEVGNITRNRVWSRVIYDDFDTINIPQGSVGVNALSSIYVSATTKSEYANHNGHKQYSNLLHAFRDRGVPLNYITSDCTLFTNFNVRNATAYTEASTGITIIEYFQYVYKNPNDAVIGMLGAMGVKEANDLMEMLNGDVPAAAASRLGIESHSPADIFKRMLDDTYEKFMHDQKVLDTVAKTRAVLNTLEPHPDGKKYSITKLEKFRTAILKKNVPTINYFAKEVEEMLADVNAEYAALKEQDGLPMTRVMDNIREMMCQICTLPLEDSGAFIVRCCGIIVCDVCGIKGNQIKNQYNYRTKSHGVSGSCANCKSVVDPRKDLIFVDHDFDMESILKAKGDEEPEAHEERPDTEETTGPEDETPRVVFKSPKLKALVNIINGQPADNCQRVDTRIDHLLIGKVDNPAPVDEPRKVVVFASYNETLDMIESCLLDQGIDYLRLGGTYRDMADTVKRFRISGSVLLINSSQNCAGLNIQFASDLVWFHNITDKNMRSQVAGRLQRLGRKHNARFHSLCYENERNL